jgi:prepilin-type N-terminal cleavage/methylation domain-containing protein/prepilin-type processing-associated H-X9-DG protein
VNRAFTLIELLIVIAIVGILASVMVPTIGGGHAVAQTALCQANQRQLVFGAHSYRNDHQKHPPAVVSMQVHWDDESILWHYLGDAEVRMACPEHDDSQYSTTGYNYNTILGDEHQLGSGITVKGVPLSDCAHPASCAMFGDGHDNKFMRATLSSISIRCGGRQSFRHRGATVVAWLDGHVSSQEKSFNNNCSDEKLVGFLSDDNAAYDPRILRLP